MVAHQGSRKAGFGGRVRWLKLSRRVSQRRNIAPQNGAQIRVQPAERTSAQLFWGETIWTKTFCALFECESHESKNIFRTTNSRLRVLYTQQQTDPHTVFIAELC